MDTTKVSAKSIRELIRINFERMISFDRASRMTIDEQLKSYFEKKADESERNIDQLQKVSAFEEVGSTENGTHTHLLSCQLFDRAISQPKVEKIIDSAARVEKHMIEWYQKVVEGFSNVPTDFNTLIKAQLTNIRNGQSMLQQLVVV